MIRSDGIASDVLVSRGVSVVEDHGNYTVLRTPSEPNYWFGNTVIMRDPPLDPACHVRVFHKEFPEVRHICIQYDIPNFQLGEMEAWFIESGFEIDHVAFLALTGPANPSDIPDGLTVRQIAGDDWDQLTDLQQEIGIEEGYNDADHRDYLEGRNRNRRAQIARGEGAWFGVFDGDLLVADMGLFHDGTIGRFQSVETRASYRNRGICAGLLTHVVDWARAINPRMRLLIAADAGGAPRRIYERAGFEPFETITAVVKRPTA